MHNNISLEIKQAAKLIDDGKLVIFPTETVYGIGADAFNEEACLEIFKVKQRPSTNPLILHCANLDIAKNIATFNKITLCLAKAFWPGPISFVLHKKKDIKIAKNISAGLDTICIRIPNNQIALDLLNATKNKIIAAPSANISNYVSPTKVDHVTDVFKNIKVLNGEQCAYGIESTIIDCANLEHIKILRHGFIDEDDIRAALSLADINNVLVTSSSNDILGSNLNTKNYLAPGMMKKHYSTHTNLQINQNNNDNLNKRIHINFGNSKFLGIKVYNLSNSGSLIEAAKNLYEVLRDADEFAKTNKINLITISSIPLTGIGIAINEKLQKAQHQ